MSREAVHEFLRKTEQDGGLREELEVALVQEQGAVASFLAAAARQGFQFTAEEFVDVVRSQQGELSETDLDKVSGGVSPGGPISGLLSRACSRLASFQSGPSASKITRPGGLPLDEEEEQTGIV